MPDSDHRPRPLPHLLIVDDVVENILALAAALESDHEIQFAHSGEQALDQLAAHPADLVLLDVMMPGIGGMETLRRLRAAPWGADIPVILVTADDRSETQVAALELGADDFVTKPIVIPAVRARIHNVLERRRLARAQADLVIELGQTNRELRRLMELSSVLFMSAGEGIYSTDIQGICTSINPAALAILGYAENEIVGQPQHRIIHHHRPDGSSYPDEECPVFQTLRDGRTRSADEAFIRKDGTFVPVQMTVSALRANEDIVGSEVLFQDISERQRMQGELMRLATTDPLTGIANRRHFLECAESERARVDRYRHASHLLMLDLDHFKDINDRHGHAAGDAVLLEFSRCVISHLRGVDFFGRIGGEEFTVLLPQTARDGAITQAERLRAAVAALEIVTSYGNCIRITVSIGIGAILPNEVSIEAAMNRADRALYAAKKAGRNRVVTT